MVPPVAEEDDPGAEWRKAIDAALEENEGTDRPTTLSDTARALAARRESNQNWQSWLTWLKRLRRTGKSSEANIVMLAAVLGQRRAVFPSASEALTKELLDRRLRSLEAEFDEFSQRIYERLQALEEGQGMQGHG